MEGKELRVESGELKVGRGTTGSASVAFQKGYGSDRMRKMKQRMASHRRGRRARKAPEGNKLRAHKMRAGTPPGVRLKGGFYREWHQRAGLQ